jgi:hypothetical protein
LIVSDFHSKCWEVLFHFFVVQIHTAKFAGSLVFADTELGEKTVTKENEAIREDSKETEAMPPAGGLAPGQRWSAERKREVVLRTLRGGPIEALFRELGLNYPV